ncbi:MAG: putative porin [Verrucomicrobia bacterium]|nr:putative porin [Verrucomicrobiota bacterium]
MNNTWKSSTTALALLFISAFAIPAVAQTSDALIDKLVQKGILTVKEAEELRVESAKSSAKTFASQMGSADWVNKLKFGGDFRGRYDGVFQDDSNTGAGSATQDRDRFRYRVRYGITAEMTDHFEVGLRLGSGEIGSAAPSLGGSPFSANTTLNNDGSRKFIFVDLAYAKWKPDDWFSAQLGKMSSDFWFTDAVLDPDYNPEGAQEKISIALNKQNKIGFSAGQFVIAENFSGTGSGSANQDVYLFVGQADWTAKWSDHLSSRLGVGAYAFANQDSVSTNLETFLNQNGTSAAGATAPHFNPIIARGEVTYTFDSGPLFDGPFPVTLGAEYANNPGASSFGSGSEAWNLGLALGDAKKKGNWQLTYNYKHIGTAAVWHGLNDDDFGVNAKGGTGVAGHQIVASYRVANPLTMNLRVMRTEQINTPAGVSSQQTRLFFDLLWAF